ncbi:MULTISPECIES: hypothetical protein [Legionella]|uniref:Uncharacterized protein n=1 Tax=Legionella resiliens TaxID=2905958 RepID=A0ABS8X8U5_9GAMM|nr:MULTISPECIES: hypothetical protein [unclassified Legionella]MCE0724373.1 hypothetical protein [Legionella sp. 9fVS26]MCE3533525.1 hypothetical protein [Legionella sp. 8cVS16]QLZ69713.1 hypothetical protein FOLKNPGA_02511 [Legionella sp. PC1000]
MSRRKTLGLFVQGLTSVGKRQFSVDRFFSLNSSMWGKIPDEALEKGGSYIPISYGGGPLTVENALIKISTLGTSRFLARTMTMDQFKEGPSLDVGGTHIPLGLYGSSQLVEYDDKGKINKKETTKNFAGHHNPDGAEKFRGYAISCSDEYTIYSLLALVTGRSSVVLIDPSALPHTHRYEQLPPDLQPSYDSHGTPSHYTFEKETTLQGIPSIFIPGRLERQGLQVVLATNPYFIDMQSKSTPQSVKDKAHIACSAYLNFMTEVRTGKPIPGMDSVSKKEARSLQMAAILENMQANLEILPMSSKDKDIYFIIYQDLKSKAPPPSKKTYKAIEVEEVEEMDKETDKLKSETEGRERGMDEEDESSVKPII